MKHMLSFKKIFESKYHERFKDYFYDFVDDGWDLSIRENTYFYKQVGEYADWPKVGYSPSYSGKLVSPNPGLSQSRQAHLNMDDLDNEIKDLLKFKSCLSSLESAEDCKVLSCDIINDFSFVFCDFGSPITVPVSGFDGQMIVDAIISISKINKHKVGWRKAFGGSSIQITYHSGIGREHQLFEKTLESIINDQAPKNSSDRELPYIYGYASQIERHSGNLLTQVDFDPL